MTINVSNPSPQFGTKVATGAKLSFDVTFSPEIVDHVIQIAYGNGSYETVFDGEGYLGVYAAGGSTRTAISGGYRYSIGRTGAWPAAPTVSVRELAFGSQVQGAAVKVGTESETETIEVGHAGASTNLIGAVTVNGEPIEGAAPANELATFVIDVYGTASDGTAWFWFKDISDLEFVASPVSAQLPSGAQVHAVRVNVEPASNANPAVRCGVQVQRIYADGLQLDWLQADGESWGSEPYTFLDPAASLAAYRQAHVLEWSGLGFVLDRSQFAYAVVVLPETGAGAQSVTATWPVSVDAYPLGPPEEEA